jgi:hypothetical protein
MGSFQGNRRSISIIGLIIPAAVILVVLTGLPSTGHPSDLIVIGGIVERVSGSDITMAAGTYDIRLARVRKPSGEEVHPSEIARGRKLDLFIQNGRVATVIVYPASMLE